MLALFLFFSRHLSIAAVWGGRGGRKGKKAADFCLGLVFFRLKNSLVTTEDILWVRWKKPTEMSTHDLQGVGSRQTHSSPLPSQAHEDAVCLLALCQFTPLWGAAAALVLCGTKAGYSGRGLLREKSTNILFRQEGRSWGSAPV